MIKSIQDTLVNVDLYNKVENIFILYDKDENEIDTIVIKEDIDYYQLFFDENVLFLHKIDTDLHTFLEDMNKEIIFTIKNHNNNMDLNYKDNILNIISLHINLRFKIKNDIFLYPFSIFLL